jgi:uncharacterized protein YdeI (YjbR/CyaY-like superfamily)
MNARQTLYVVSRREWRNWLSGHQKNKEGVWLVFHKKSSGKPTIDYDEAVEEALCYGWIDGQIKHLDEEKYARCFTPRRQRTSWSESNRRRALKMLRQRKMTLAGLRCLPTELLRDAKSMANT